jgi:sporulation protein YlmC with PRC-barrel domain
MRSWKIAVLFALLSAPALAQSPAPALPPSDAHDWAPVGTSPAPSFTISNYYKQDVYDRSDNKLGSIDDVLIDNTGKVTALMIGVGGFLGIGQKDVAVPFNRVQMGKKNDKWYLSLDATKEQLKAAPGYKYDSGTTSWVPDQKGE